MQQKSLQLSNKCVQILNALNDKAPDLDGSEMQQDVDQLIGYVFENHVLGTTYSFSNSASWTVFGVERKNGQTTIILRLFVCEAACAIYQNGADHPALVNNGDIRNGLDRCHSDLDAALNLFHVGALVQIAPCTQSFAD